MCFNFVEQSRFTQRRFNHCKIVTRTLSGIRYQPVCNVKQQQILKQRGSLLSFSEVRLSKFHQRDGRCVKPLRRNRTVVKKFHRRSDHLPAYS